MKTMRAAIAGLMVFSSVAESRAVLDANGWTDMLAFLVPSDGSRSLGNNMAWTNSTRDQGSKIVFFDVLAPDNASAEVYWWDGSRIIDSGGSPTNGMGLAYGTDPLHPNESAIKPFKYPVKLIGNGPGDPRLRTHNGQEYGTVSGGYPDWFLFRRGRLHDTFDAAIGGGRSESEPMVIAAYGPESDGRAVIAPLVGAQVTYEGRTFNIANPFYDNAPGTYYFHEVRMSLEFRADISHLDSHTGTSQAGGPPTLLMEDCKLVAARLSYLPRKTTIRRGSSSFKWDAAAHNQGYYTVGYVAGTTFEDFIFYKNGYKTDPKTDVDPTRDIFSRNVYEGGGSQMGHTYRNVIFADGASGGPQMRLGGLIENSLIIEGYWFSSTNSNNLVNSWLPGQTGQSAVVRDNVQLVLKYPNAADPDSAGTSSPAAQPGWGYSLAGASFGSVVENNIVSLAMLSDDLGVAEASVANGYEMGASLDTYQDGNAYNLKNNVFRGNISYRTSRGLSFTGNWNSATGCLVENNVFVSNSAVNNASSNITGPSQLEVRNNRFYTNGSSLPSGAWMGPGNTLSPYSGAAASEGWSDPNRTLKRYVVEVLGLTLLDGSEANLALPPAAGEVYDPAGLKTFMAVATNMRKGSATPAPSSGKPSWTGDYAWDDRYTARAVVNWIRAGFGMPPVGGGSGLPADSMPPARPRNLRLR